MEFKNLQLEDVIVLEDKKRKPLSTMDRSKRKGIYPYYGAQEIIDSIDDYIFDGKYILLAEDGENLKSRKKDLVKIVEGKFWLNNHAHIFKVKENVDLEYLYYYLLKLDLGEYITGSTQPKLNQENMNKIKIKLPELKIQRKISKILSNIDGKIKLNNEINNNLYDLGKSYFEDFISNCDREVAIKDIANEVLDYTKNKNDKVKLLNSSDVTENIFPKVEFVDNKDLKGHFKKRFKKHDILYSQIRPRNHHYGYVLLDDSENYLASTRFMVVRNKKEKVSSSLLYYYLTSKNAVEDFTTKTELRSGTFPQGNYEDLSSYVVKYSSNQESITKILDLILETINNNNNENEKLSQLRDTLLPKLMNGEIDLDNIEI